ncbi:MAG: YggT family protein [Terricaulis sp.]
MIPPIFHLIDAILGLIVVLLLVHVVLSWLIAFEIVSRRNSIVGTVFEFTTRLTDPILRPLRRIIPPIAGVDLSILILMLAIFFIRDSLPYLQSLLRG